MKTVLIVGASRGLSHEFARGNVEVQARPQPSPALIQPGGTQRHGRWAI